jgi:hypothetical protein
MTVSNKTNTIRRYHLYNSTGKEVEPEKSEGEKDIGVLVDDQLKVSIMSPLRCLYFRVGIFSFFKSICVF